MGDFLVGNLVENSGAVLDNIGAVVFAVELVEEGRFSADVVIGDGQAVGFDESVLDPTKQVSEGVGWVPVDDFGDSDFAGEGVDVRMKHSSIIVYFWRL